MKLPSIQSLSKASALCAAVILGLVLTSDAAMAQQSPMGNVVCMIIGIIYGNLGRGLAILAVIILGVGATIGKVSWGLAMTVAVGIATIFGAVPLTAYLISGSASTSMCGGVGGVG
jgi:type IV secretory pathway VirB2 component (pilin)